MVHRSVSSESAQAGELLPRTSDLEDGVLAAEDGVVDRQHQDGGKEDPSYSSHSDLPG